MEKETFYVTTPIFYVNGAPHIGHAYTAIAADVIARYHRMHGTEVHFLTGTDEHGTKIADKAKEAGKETQEFVDENAAKFQMLFDRLNISNNDFIRTTEKRHKDGVEKFMKVLEEKNAFYQDQYEGLYCVGCERFITTKELVDGKCPDHKTVPEKLAETNYFFKLSEYLPQVKELIARNEIQIEPERIRKEVLGLLDNNVLADFSVSRESVKWGIELPFEKSQVIYVWVEALQNYITALAYADDEELFNKFWPADLHIVGKDIIKFHAIFWPAMLLATGLEPPKQIFAHGFFTINGDKMSKSLGNIIDPEELITEFGADATRYLLLTQFPFGQDGDIKADKFIEQYNADLANGISNLLHRSLSMTEKYLGGIVPDRFEEPEELINAGGINTVWDDYKSALESNELGKGLEVVHRLVTISNDYIEKHKPWDLANHNLEKLKEVVYTFLEINRHISFMLHPYLPDTAEKMQEALGIQYEEHMTFDEFIKWGQLPPGTDIKKDVPLFQRING